MIESAALQLTDRFSYRPMPTRLTRMNGQRHAEVVPLPTRHGGAPGSHEPAFGAPPTVTSARTPTRTPTRQPAGLGGEYRTIELRLLGGFRLLVGGQLAHVGRTGERLLAVVACRGRQATRSQIAHSLWPDTTSSRAHANLRTALYRLARRAPSAIHATTSYLQLPVGMQIDLEQTTRLANQVLSNDAADPGLLNDALRANLYDDLLPDWDDEWLGDTQYRYRQLRLTALETLSHQLAAAGQFGAAVQTALAAVQADPLRDSAHEILIRACLAQGNRHEAFTHYTSYRRILRDELGLDPPAAIGQLFSTAASSRPLRSVRPYHDRSTAL